MPLSFKNYTLSALPTECISLWRFTIVTFLVNLPYTFAWGAIGSTAGASLRDNLSGLGASNTPIHR